MAGFQVEGVGGWTYTIGRSGILARNPDTNALVSISPDKFKPGATGRLAVAARAIAGELLESHPEAVEAMQDRVFGMGLSYQDMKHLSAPQILPEGGPEDTERLIRDSSEARATPSAVNQGTLGYSTTSQPPLETSEQDTTRRDQNKGWREQFRPNADGTGGEYVQAG